MSQWEGSSQQQAIVSAATQAKEGAHNFFPVGREAAESRLSKFAAMTKDEAPSSIFDSCELDLENQKLVKELQGGVSPGVKNQKRTGQSKYLTTSNRFGVGAKVVK